MYRLELEGCTRTKVIPIPTPHFLSPSPLYARYLVPILTSPRSPHIFQFVFLFFYPRASPSRPVPVIAVFPRIIAVLPQQETYRRCSSLMQHLVAPA